VKLLRTIRLDASDSFVLKKRGRSSASGQCQTRLSSPARQACAVPPAWSSQLNTTAFARIVVGVIVERRKARSNWVEFLWRPVSVFVGSPSAVPWTPLGVEAEVTLFYAGQAVVELHRTETTNYRDNLASGAPGLWVVLRPTASGSSYELLGVTADPAEGEAFTDAGNNLVDQVPMPPVLAETIRQFIAEHHVDRPFVKRQRDRQALQSEKGGRP
jgi:hypothetical protein